ncbi:MAG: S8 family peptidase, partial [Erysipelotrichaceae bacterium]
MNNILILKGQLKKQKVTGGFGKPKLSKGKQVSAEHVLKLKEELEKISNYWNKDKTIKGALVSVHYRQVIAKSNRLQILLSDNGKHPNESVRGSKFSYENGVQRHVFTYFLSLKSLEKSIDILDRCQKTIEAFYNGIVGSEDIELINNGKYDGNILPRSTFVKTVIDCYYVDYFNIDTGLLNITDGKSIVTVYKTGTDIKELLENLGINLLNVKMIDEATIQLDKSDADILYDKVPYLVAMSVRDFNEISCYLNDSYDYKSQITISKPGNEPVVGVIDTHFDTGVYFNEWVEYHNCLDPNITLDPKDYLHGTAVSSIIVDGPSFNPRLQDNCGHFRVRHFGVATASSFSSLSIIRNIRKIVRENQDIKVWNISLGSPIEISENFISVEAAELDKIQNEFDVIFVVAGTNREEKYKSVKIGSPADSLNSLVVNAVDFKGNPAYYTRKGPVLSFFYKPDVSYYGGDISDGITVCEPLGAREVMGTSFAAPWITRKM